MIWGHEVRVVENGEGWRKVKVWGKVLMPFL
jgi:hypothetical protein